MTDIYKKPIQPRARATEQRFLDALHELLQEKSLSQLTTHDIADRAQLTRSAFLKRFGSKRQALLVLYERYCNKASVVMVQLKMALPEYSNAIDICVEMSRQLEKIQTLDFPANRAMHEDFLEKLEIALLTKKIFLECVDLMRGIQKQFLSGTTATDEGAFAAAQLLVTINYNHVLKAMPALPSNSEKRHSLNGRIVAMALEM